MAYETITLDQLTNRAANAYHQGDCGIPETPETFFSAQYWSESRKAWWNGFETTDQEKAEATLARWRKMGSTHDMRIVIVVVVKHESTKEEGEIIAEVSPATIEVSEQSGEAVKASSVVFTTAKTIQKTSLDWNKATRRYEAEIDGNLYCVEEEAFADRFIPACNASTDDEYRIWSVLTWLSSWDFSGKQAGVYILG